MVETQRCTYTVKEVAGFLGVSPAAVYKAVADGAMPGIRVGRRVVIPRQWVSGALEPVPAESAHDHVDQQVVPATERKVLTHRQSDFVRAFAESGGRNPPKLATEAGYPAETAHIGAHRLLRKKHIMAAIKATPRGVAAIHALNARTRSKHIKRAIGVVMDARFHATVALTPEGRTAVFTFTRSCEETDQ